MDFLKTLLAYMTLMATLGVQEGPAPAAVPTPTPLPPSVTATAVPHQTAAPTATPSPSPAPTPAITPNNRYKQVDFGSSGNNVKKLQNALIELGYMEEGSADSQYGYQTYNAVKAFQRANGLTADGVAGPKTLTVLYEDPNVIGVVEETPVPTATPTPSLPPLPTLDPSYAVKVDAAQSAADTPAKAVQLTRLEDANIISGTDGAILYRETLVDGNPALVKPALWQNADGTAVVSLAELTDCMPGWTFMGSSADGLYSLNACGYVVSIQVASNGVVVLVDGERAEVSAADVMLKDNVLYVTDAFLSSALNAQTVFDEDEKSLLLILKDKSIASAQD